MTDHPAEARERIEALTVAISVRSLPRVVRPLLESRFTIQQLKVLTSVVAREGVTVTDLVADFAVSMATMSKLVERLVSQGLVQRVPDIADLRVRRLHATPLGHNVVAKIIGARPELGRDVLDGLDEGELVALETGLTAINRELHRLARES
ncbi:MarR family winged helix-turn-helix transcriptional regulator [Microbacterium sp. NPDC089320]|uniref:MarR family winged helix-turn-helix transcriptional regulator n=1 Tax=Microbacterium sp. NPDC089320 TaxID=3155182 RepID=UPI003447B065